MHSKILILPLLLLIGASLFGYSEKGWLRDVKKNTGTLSAEQQGVAEYTRDSLLDQWNTSLKQCNKDQYKELVIRCSAAAMDDKMVTLFKMGKAGEKGLKALILLTEEWVGKAGKKIDEKAAEYDKKHNKEKQK